MKNLGISKTDAFNKPNQRTIGGALPEWRKIVPEGKMYGRTFGMQSLRNIASCEPCQRLAGSEVLLSLLPRIEQADYTISLMADREDPALQTSLLPIAVGALAIRGSEAGRKGQPWPPG